MSNIKEVTSSIHNYSISFEQDTSFLEPLLNTAEAVFVVDQNVFELYPVFSSLKGKENLLLLNAIEENKTLHASEAIFDKIIALKPTKKTKIISIGGGITQDVTGFVASTFYRGLKWTYVPTTLLAQADSCMGSKTSLNYKSYKNILGTFYPPHQIHICTQFTNTLTEEDFYSGMGEVAKLHVMGGMDTLELLLGHMGGIHRRDNATILAATKRSLDIKWTYMDGDEFDQGKRNLLNYGHEFGHAIETATNYKIPHGQAIVMGMILANEVGLRKGIISTELNNKLNILFFDILKTDYKQLKQVDNARVLEAMKQDKKRTGSGLPLILMDDEFKLFKITDLTTEEAAIALDHFKDTYCYKWNPQKNRSR